MAVGVVLLAAGYGTRLHPLTKDCPKALLPLGGGVVMDPMLEAVAGVPGVSKTILVSNHRFIEQFQAWQGKVSVTLELVDDGSVIPEQRLGAIRDLLLALSRIDPRDDVLVLGTDNLFTWSLDEFVAAAKAKRPSPTIAVYEVATFEEASQCGVVEMDRQARVLRCVEKPRQPASKTVGLCVYYFPAPMRGRINEFITTGGNGDAPGYFVEWLVQREPVYGFVAGGEWYDIGTTAAYHEAVRRWANRPSLRSL